MTDAIDERHYRRLEALYRAAPCNRYYAPRIAVSEGRAEIVIAVRADLFHAAGAVHGSAYFKALDDAAFFAANSLVPDVFVLTASFHLHLTRPISSGEMRAAGEVVHRSRSRLIAEAVLCDAEGRQLARGSGVFVRSRIRLDELAAEPDPNAGSAAP